MFFDKLEKANYFLESILETLDEKSKITELASMVSGQEITSESIDYARGMLGK